MREAAGAAGAPGTLLARITAALAAIGAAASVPARLIGREDLATLRPGTRADVAVLDDALVPRRTIMDGVEVWSR